MKYRYAIVMLIALLAAAAMAQTASVPPSPMCSPATTAGKYVVVCDGQLTPAPGAPMVPAKLLSVGMSDRHGNITGDGTVSLAGTALQQHVEGTEHLNPDCTGTITYQTWINGQPGSSKSIAIPRNPCARLFLLRLTVRV